MGTASSSSPSSKKSSNNDVETSQEELSAGLLAQRAYISPKYFYDTIGSVLFEAICVLPEYYLTRVEASIFNQHQTEIAQAIPIGSTLIDLGAGNCEKAAKLFPLIHPNQYVPIDISVEHLTDAVQHLQQRFPRIEMMALGRDFSTNWTLPVEVRRDHRLFFYPGSSIGNLEPEAALAFLKQLRTFCDDDGGLLIGIDLIKDQAILKAAYNDALGITSAFNLNALRHINQILGSNFDVHQWQHHAAFNETLSCVEMFLEAKTDIAVKWKTHQRNFAQGERLHTEYSYKYQLPSFLAVLNQAGFGHAHYWTDKNEWYAVIYAKAL